MISFFVFLSHAATRCARLLVLPLFTAFAIPSVTFAEDQFTSEVCGLHCLYVAMIALSDEPPSLKAVEERLAAAPAGGYSIEELSIAARELGYETRAVRTSVGWLKKRQRGFICIALVDKGHFVIISELRSDSVEIIDPPNRRGVLIEDLITKHGWNGLAVYQCPSDSSAGINYRANIGSEPYSRGIYGGEILGGNGAFNSHEKLRSSDFTDGLSNTVAFSERKIGHGNGVVGEDIWITGQLTDPDNIIDANEVRASYSRSCPSSEIFEYSGHEWTTTGLTHTWYNHIRTPQPKFCDLVLDGGVVQGTTPVGGAVAPSSFHFSGVNVAMMDGSTRFVTSRIGLAEWVKLGTRVSSELAID